jgi:hypothetical protein
MEEVHREFWFGDLTRRGHLEYVERRTILNCIFFKRDGETDWINLAQDRDSWRVFVNVVMNLRVLGNAGIS